MVRCIGIVPWVPEEYATAQELADDLRRFLADMLHKQRQWEEARRLHEEALGRQRKVPGDDYPDWPSGAQCFGLTDLVYFCHPGP